METVGQYIYELRIQKGLTQDQFGKMYQISGPAVFKFEKGFVKPSLELWLRIAKDIDITERMAVLLWIRDRLPENFQDVIQLTKSDKDEIKKSKEKKVKFESRLADIKDPKELKKKISRDKKIPAGLRELMNDDEIWSLYKPTGAEVDFLLENFGQFENAGKNQFREALRLYRDFAATSKK